MGYSIEYRKENLPLLQDPPTLYQQEIYFGVAAFHLNNIIKFGGLVVFQLSHLKKAIIYTLKEML